MRMTERIGEALRLRAYMLDRHEFVAMMADMFCAKPQKGDAENFYHFLETIYNAGCIEGIRQERKHRKGAAA